MVEGYREPLEMKIRLISAARFALTTSSSSTASLLTRLVPFLALGESSTLRVRAEQFPLALADSRRPGGGLLIHPNLFVLTNFHLFC
jgi:hypothetical protein